MKGRIICVILIFIFVFVPLCPFLLWWNFRHNTKELSYNVMDYGAKGNGEYDDSKAFLSAWNNACGAKGKTSLVIPKGKVFLLKDLELKGPCNAPSIHIQLAGKIVAPTMDKWGDDKTFFIKISKVNSLTINGGGNIEGNGNIWWEKSKNDSSRPGLLSFNSCNDLSVSSLNLANSPRSHIAIHSCKHARFFNMIITAPGNSPNTDGYDISNSKNIAFEDSTIATGDDCIAINGGCSSINATRLSCGPGHGISVGSLGKNNGHEIVENVYVKNCTFNGTTNGARIKTWEGGSGYVRNIIYENIILIDADNPIIIDQHYGSKRANNKSVSLEISDVTFQSFEGTSADARAIRLNCSSNGCHNIRLDQINIVSSNSKKKAQALCNNAHGLVGQVIPNISCIME